MKRHVYLLTVVSLRINERVDLVQNKHHHHLIKNNLFTKMT